MMREGSTVATDLGALPIERTPLASTTKDFPMFGPFRKLTARSSVWAMAVLLTGTGLAGAEESSFFDPSAI